MEKLDYRLSHSRSLALPALVPVEQEFEARCLDDVPGAVQSAYAAVAPTLPPLAGKRIALTAGSRGIKNIVPILGTLAACLKQAGAQPFIVPAMGSHGGATAQGQEAVLAGYGITGQSIGIPLAVSMDTVTVGALEDGTPVYCDRHAWEADYFVPVGRVKPHPDFKAAVESGLCKMLAIGLGNHEGAKALHHRGFDRMSLTIEETAGVLVATGHVLFGLGIVENAYSRTMKIEAVPAAALVEQDKALLAEAKAAMGKLHFAAIDILLVDQIGKEISGAGMDPNITGRPVTGQPGFTAPPIQNIVVLDLSDRSGGNAVGVGMADVVPLKLVEKIDFSATYTNSITAAGLLGSKLPLVAKDDLDALIIAYCACHRVTPETVKIVHIKNTSSISRIEASVNMLDEIHAHPHMRAVGDAERLVFADGILQSRL